MSAVTSVAGLLLAASSWWGGSSLEEISKTEIVAIATKAGYTAKEVSAADTRVSIKSPNVNFVSYLDNCRTRSGRRAWTSRKR